MISMFSIPKIDYFASKCTHSAVPRIVNYVSGKNICQPCIDIRMPGYFCGTEGKLFTSKNMEEKI
jgi:hypothetical protein